jgi:polar amino acid transport system ATP-binding protein/sulfate transport system ATP-binding protein
MVLLHGAPVKRGEVGVVGQSYPLFRNKTVIQNLRSVPHGNNKKDLEDKISFYLDRLRIADLKNSFPINLSGGQRQRVAIVQQMLCSEHFLLLDEPFASLDPLMTQEVCRLIDDIANASDLHTVIVVSHDITSTVAISTELWLLGYDHDEAGNPIPENGARIKYKEDLMKMGLAWEFPGIYENPKFLEFVKDIRMTFRKL